MSKTISRKERINQERLLHNTKMILKTTSLDRTP
jgi:hypothetical protein